MHSIIVRANTIQRRGLVGHRADWSQPQIESYSVTLKGVEKKKSKAKGYDAITILNALKSDAQRRAISKVLSSQRFNEKNQFATWDYVVILPMKEKVPGSLGYASEIKSIEVILKRHPKPQDSYPQMPLSNMYNIQQDPGARNMAPQLQNQMNHSMQPQVNPKMNNMSQGNAKIGNMSMNGQGHGNLPPPPPQHHGNMQPPGRPLDGVPRDTRVDARGQQPGMPGPPPNAIPGAHNQQRPPMNRPMQGNPARQSMDNVEKMQGWRDRNGGFIANESADSDDSGSSSPGISHGKPFNPRNPQGPMGAPPGAMGQGVPRPPAGLPYQAGNAQRQSRPGSPILKKKISTRDIPTGDRNVYQAKKDSLKPSRRYSGGSSSTTSYDMLSDISQHSRSTRATDYSLGSSEHGDRRRSRSHVRDRQDDDSDSRHRRGSRTRDRGARGHHSRRHDEPHSLKDRKYREHRRPLPFHGLSSRHASDSDNDRDRPIEIHNHYQYPGQSRRSVSPGGSSTASLWGGSLHQQKRLQYTSNDPYDMRSLRTDLPPVAMAPTLSLPLRGASAEAIRISHVLKEQQRRKEQDVEAYMRSEEQKAREIEAFERGRGVHRQRKRNTITDALFDDPVEQQSRHLADRDWDDIDWNGHRTSPRSTRDGWKIADDLLSSDNMAGGYGTTSSRRFSNDLYDDTRYGQTGYSVRGGRDAYVS